MKIGTIGNGMIVKDFLEGVRHLQKTEDIEVVSMLALRAEDLDATRNLGALFEITNICDNYDDLLNYEEIDYIYIALPNALHFKYSLKALEHGKNVLCEKPFTSTKEQAHILIETAKRNRLMIFETITTIFFPNYELLKHKLNEIGNISLVQCNFSHISSKYKELKDGKTPNVFNLNMAGGALVDMNIYNIHFVLNMFGKPQSAKYFATIYNNGIDTSGMLVLKYANMNAVCISAKDSYGKNQLLIQGEKGYIICECGANFISGFKIVIGKDERVFNLQNEEPRLYYELKRFLEIYQQKDYETCYSMLSYTEMVVSLCEDVRKEAGIIYPQDSES